MDIVVQFDFILRWCIYFTHLMPQSLPSYFWPLMLFYWNCSMGECQGPWTQRNKVLTVRGLNKPSKLLIFNFKEFRNKLVPLHVGLQQNYNYKLVLCCISLSNTSQIYVCNSIHTISNNIKVKYSSSFLHLLTHILFVCLCSIAYVRAKQGFAGTSCKIVNYSLFCLDILLELDSGKKI